MSACDNRNSSISRCLKPCTDFYTGTLMCKNGQNEAVHSYLLTVVHTTYGFVTKSVSWYCYKLESRKSRERVAVNRHTVRHTGPVSTVLKLRLTPNRSQEYVHVKRFVLFTISSNSQLVCRCRE